MKNKIKPPTTALWLKRPSFPKLAAYKTQGPPRRLSIRPRLVLSPTLPHSKFYGR